MAAMFEQVPQAAPDPILGLTESYQKDVHPNKINLSVGVGMLLRMFIPLAAGTWLHAHVAALADAGLLYYVVGFYFLTLFVEIALTLPANPATSSTLVRR